MLEEDIETRANDARANLQERYQTITEGDGEQGEGEQGDGEQGDQDVTTTTDADSTDGSDDDAADSNEQDDEVSSEAGRVGADSGDSDGGSESGGGSDGNNDSDGDNDSNSDDDSNFLWIIWVIIGVVVFGAVILACYHHPIFCQKLCFHKPADETDSVATSQSGDDVNAGFAQAGVSAQDVMAGIAMSENRCGLTPIDPNWCPVDPTVNARRQNKPVDRMTSLRSYVSRFEV
jgi:hypothetical protein